VVTTLAGTAGLTGSTDATGAAARFNFPQGVATDSAGNVYVGDTNNNTVRKITPAGVVTTLAGTAGVTGSTDATGAAASFFAPLGVATDSAGNVYVADLGNHTIRKITPAGVVTTLAGTAGAFGSTDATGAAARFDGPFGVATDSAGNVYVADSGNSTLRKITPAGAVSTLAGVAGQTGFAPGALPGLLGNPSGVAVSGTSLYITIYNGVAVVQNLP
jgi:streptogramin lyase